MSSSSNIDDARRRAIEKRGLFLFALAVVADFVSSVVSRLWYRRPPILIGRRWELFIYDVRRRSVPGMWSSVHLRLTIWKQTRKWYRRVPFIEAVRNIAYHWSSYRKFCEQYR